MAEEDNELDEIMKKLMKFPNLVAEQLGRHSKLIAKLAESQEMVIELVCKLHDIDVNEIRKELS